nr:MAG TPA: hypothetical protein [Caudoviricetes sp.]
MHRRHKQRDGTLLIGFFREKNGRGCMRQIVRNTAALFRRKEGNYDDFANHRICG